MAHRLEPRIGEPFLTPAEVVRRLEGEFAFGLAMIEAAKLFRELIERYPNSDKIDDAAFYCGEIHKDYLPGQDEIAVRWYERVWTWNPETEHPARFQAASIYDYRLRDRVRALELYQAAIDHESQHEGNAGTASRRMRELTKVQD